MLQRDPAHEEQTRQLLQLTPQECKRRIAIADYRSPEYVAAEVLATIVRTRHGQRTGVLDRAASVLWGRTLILVKSYLRGNPQWDGLAASDSETLEEAASYVFNKLLLDERLVSFSEVRFLPFVENATQDYLRSQLTLKNAMPSVDGMVGTDQDGASASYLDTIPGDDDDSPEIAAIRAQTAAALAAKLLALPLNERLAFYYRVELEFGWATVASLLGVTIPTARAYLIRSIEKLQGALS